MLDMSDDQQSDVVAQMSLEGYSNPAPSWLYLCSLSLSLSLQHPPLDFATPPESIVLSESSCVAARGLCNPAQAYALRYHVRLKCLKYLKCRESERREQ